eukprot:TRINITY_DN11551_c0_g1_i1.p1 TRINITY_DN11551_c0_g1~~TRINITY_DN11551_c0_g1_i1.p1  ORF type:complete len:383 (+),score=115.90 TRINITY_DN11551_c0_g1_i1:171-1151(+)
MGAIATLTNLLNIPDTHEVLFAQGGASMAFASVALNLGFGKRALYLVSGQWSAKAAKEAEKYCEKVDTIKPPKPESKDDPLYTVLPVSSSWRLPEDEAKDVSYVYYCDNETVDGVEFNFVPQVPDSVPLVSDMSSNFCSKPIDVSKFGLIYAGAQKNVGPAGLVIIIVRKDLLGNAPKICPTLMDYKILSDNKSLYNTPPTFSIYVSYLVFKWLEGLGGLTAMAAINQDKAQKLYGFLNGSKLFVCPVKPENRSVMNVVFRLRKNSSDLEKKISAEAKSQGLVAFEGHRSVGGFRVSLYNAQSLANVEKLVAFLEKFDSENQLSSL